VSRANRWMLRLAARRLNNVKCYKYLSTEDVSSLVFIE